MNQDFLKDNSEPSINYRPLSLTEKLFRFVTLGFKEQDFLGQPWIPLLLKAAPRRYKRSLALNFLGMSPHYFKRLAEYSALPRQEVLETEHQRNAASRQEICEQILRPYMQPQMIVLDFGCGPGYLARAVAKHVKQVMAVDISCGVIACARELNPSGNLSYYINNGQDLSTFAEASMDLIYSFAVVQHLSDALFKGFLTEFWRVLRPGGKVVCHIALDVNNNPSPNLEDINILPVLRRLEKRFELRMVYRATDEVRQKIVGAGFNEPVVTLVREISDIEDDIAAQHLFIFDKPGQVSTKVMK